LAWYFNSFIVEGMSSYQISLLLDSALFFFFLVLCFLVHSELSILLELNMELYLIHTSTIYQSAPVIIILYLCNISWVLYIIEKLMSDTSLPWVMG